MYQLYLAKGGVADRYGRLVGEIVQVPARAKEERDILFDHMLHVIHKLMQAAGETEITGIGMAFPGSSDSQNRSMLLPDQSPVCQ